MYAHISFKKLVTAISFIILMISGGRVSAQVPTTAAAYPFTASTKPYVYLTGGTSVNLQADDITATGIPIGFTFPFCTGSYTTLAACSNGFLSLSNNGGATFTNGQGNMGAMVPMIMPIWDDLYGIGGTSTYLTTGTAPNRIFTFEWRNWRPLSFTGSAEISMQVQLHEGGIIEFFYKREGTNPLPSATIGIAFSSTDYQTLPIASTNPTPSSTTYNAGITAYPATDQSYMWGQIPCTGVPTTAVSGPNEVCPNKPFGLTLNGMSLLSGLTYQWQQSTNGTTWTNFPGGTTLTITDAILAPKWYRAQVTCTNSGQSFTTPAHKVTIAPFYYCYCEGSKATATTGIDIGNMKVLTAPFNQAVLDNGSATPFLSNTNANKTYTDFRYSVPPVPMYHDSSFYLQVSQISSTGTFAAATAAIFIDYNRNGKFDPWERVLQEVTSQALPNPGVVRDTFTVPDSAGYGLTGMRVILRAGTTAPDTCQNYPEGETEDYLVDLRYRPCDSANITGTIEGDTSMCVGYDYILTDSTYQKERHGLSRLWQRSADNIGWVDVSNSLNNDSLMRIFTGQPLYYRVRQICSHTNDTGYSIVHKVNLKPTYKCYCFSQSLGGSNDTSDIGGFSLYTYSNNDGGAHLGNQRAVRKRQDYTDIAPVEMWVDSLYQFHVFHTMPGENHSDGKITVFADFNNNHQYDIPEERIYTGFTNVGYHTLISNVVIPNAAIVDVPTGLRVIVNNNVGPNDPSDIGCGTYISGETEDYMVTFRRPFNVSVNTVTELRNVQIYPNPTSGRFSISFYAGNTLKEVKVKILTVTGQQVQSEVYSHGGGRFTQELDLGSRARGVYFVELEADGVKDTKRIVLQ